MFFLMGSLIVMVCVFGGFIMMGGHIDVLMQPMELLIMIRPPTGRSR